MQIEIPNHFFNLTDKRYISPMPNYYPVQRQYPEKTNEQRYEVFSTVNIFPKNNKVYEKRSCIEEKMNDVLLKKVCNVSYHNYDKTIKKSNKSKKTIKSNQNSIRENKKSKKTQRNFKKIHKKK
jgi:hypothetical protein